MNNKAQTEAMDRAGELPMERRVAERRTAIDCAADLRAATLRALASHPAAPVQPVAAEGTVLLPTEINAVVQLGFAYLDAAREESPRKAWSFSHAGYFAMLEKAKSMAKSSDAAPPVQQPGDVRDSLAEFTAYVVKNYPADTIIGDPAWHAPRLFRAAQRAILAASGGAHAVPDGWQLVPKHATPEMLKAFFAEDYTQNGYVEMLAAAPTQDQGEGK